MGAARALLPELRRAGDAEAATRLERARRAPASSPSPAGFQLNFRVLLERLTPARATHHPGKMTSALDVLAERASEADPAEVEALANRLENALSRLRAGG